MANARETVAVPERLRHLFEDAKEATQKVVESAQDIVDNPVLTAPDNANTTQPTLQEERVQVNRLGLALDHVKRHPRRYIAIGGVAFAAFAALGFNLVGDDDKPAVHFPTSLSPFSSDPLKDVQSQGALGPEALTIANCQSEGDAVATFDISGVMPLQLQLTHPDGVTSVPLMPYMGNKTPSGYPEMDIDVVGRIYACQKDTLEPGAAAVSQISENKYEVDLRNIDFKVSIIESGGSFSPELGIVSDLEKYTDESLTDANNFYTSLLSVQDELNESQKTVFAAAMRSLFTDMTVVGEGSQTANMCDIPGGLEGVTSALKAGISYRLVGNDGEVTFVNNVANIGGETFNAELPSRLVLDQDNVAGWLQIQEGCTIQIGDMKASEE